MTFGRSILKGDNRTINLVLLSLFFLCVGLSSACSVTNWRDMSMAERLYRSDIVVYGKEVHHIQRNDSSVPGGASVDSEFRVMCVLKGDNHTINETILIEQVDPRTTCSGTSGKVFINMRVIVGLKRTQSGNYEWHEVNVIQTAAFPATESTFETAADVCGLEDWLPPTNGDAKNCPVYTTTEPCMAYTDSGSILTVKVSTILLCVVFSLLRILH